jgi:hypothetical protein
MESGDTQRAIASIRDLARELWARKVGSFSPDGLETAFQALLHRRGYFVSTPSDLSASLADIQALGEGFDLYDLARSLAELDTVTTECLKLSACPLLPELRPFSTRCPCGDHSKRPF